MEINHQSCELLTKHIIQHSAVGAVVHTPVLFDVHISDGHCRVYVLDTENGVVMKKVVHTEKSDSLHCVSLNPNPDYAPFDIPRSSIYGIYRVLGLLAKK